MRLRDQNLLMTSPCGCGKTCVGCALSNNACKQGYSVQYWCMSGLPDELTYGLADGIYRKKLTRLILDDWWVNRSRLRTVTVMISQRPTEEWDGSMGDNTFADEFPGSLMHNAKRLDINGESMRKRPAQVN